MCDAKDETAVPAGVPAGGVAAASERGTPEQLAAELGCAEQTLQNWRRHDEADRGERGDLLSSEERARLRELERENKVLRQEREILKRAAAFFIRESDRP